ncbi:protein phosphatase CheZ [Radicibacter daui]|uniref:protein phosphatase CheZ n=1 Tax=Radicibacter daui TaxID=3064829 RepID=UPI004046B7EA
MARLPELSDDEYLEIEETLSSNARGRAFLRMRDQRMRVIGSDEVRRLIRNMKDAVARTVPAEGDSAQVHVRILRQELQEMSYYIQQTRAEIAALQPDNSGDSRFISATEELSSIVTSTERATYDILNAAERISEGIADVDREGELGSVIDMIEGQTIEIMTACSFQDITGQRITKVVNAMRYIEQRINSMVDIWGSDDAASAAAAAPVRPARRDDVVDSRPDSHLLNGPAKDGEGVSQSDVDALLAGIGGSAPAPVAEEEVAPPPPPKPVKAKEPPPKAEKKPEPPPPPPPPAPASTVEREEDMGGEPISQADIDALFD